MPENTNPNDELETPIKINWTGDARSKFKGRKVRARVADEGPHGEETLRTLDRLKTRVVVRTREEAEALESMLDGMKDADYTWTTENHRNAYRRVLSELRDEIDAREWDDEGDEAEVRADGEGITVENVLDLSEEDLSDLSDDDLDAADAAVTELLNAPPFEAFDSDDELRDAFTLASAITEEFENRDPRRDDPYFHPGDTEERFDLSVSGVEIYEEADEIRARLTLDEDEIPGGRGSSEWRLRPETDIAETVLDYYGLDELRELGTVVGDTLPVVGHDSHAWGRVDRFALENDGENALDDEDDPVLLPDGGQVLPDDDEEQSSTADEPRAVQVRGEVDGISTLAVYYDVAGTLFRARLRPSSALPEDETTHRGEALTLTDLSEVVKEDGDLLPVVGDVEAVEWFDPTHVPPVVRGAVQRPVQVPDRPALSDE